MQIPCGDHTSAPRSLVLDLSIPRHFWAHQQLLPALKVSFWHFPVMHESNLPKVRPSRDDVPASEGCSDPEVTNHAAKIHGCAYAWALLSRVLLAPPWCRWQLLPSVPALCRGI